MVARIHHRKHGVEYVLQYDSRVDRIELRKNRYTLIGGIPNYFRHEWGTYVREMDFLKGTVLVHRPISGRCPHPYPLPQLSDAEKVLIHEFEKIAGVNLLFTPESVQRHIQSLTEGAANALAEAARSLRGLDLNPLISYANRITDSQRRLAETLLATGDLEERLSHLPDPPPSTEPRVVQEPSHLVNTEGLTEEQIQENLEFIARLQNGESIPATEFPLRDRNCEAQNHDTEEAAFDAFMKEIDEVLEADDSDDETIRAAPSHHPEISAETMQSLWKQARQEDSDQ